MALKLDIGISYIDADSNHIPDLSQTIIKAIEVAMAEVGCLRPKPLEISVVIANDRFLQKLNNKYRNTNQPTNVLAFPASQGDWENGTNLPIVLGDIVLSLETISAEAKEQQKTLTAHLCHLVMHGLLHLLGYNHGTSSAAKIMENIERKALAEIGISDPYTCVRNTPVKAALTTL